MKTPLHRVADALVKRLDSTSVSRTALARETAAYLLDSGRTGELNSLARDMIRTRAAAGIVEVTAVCAHEVGSSVEAAIRSEVKKLYPAVKKIIINYRLDPNVIGGIRLELVDQQLDLSVRNTLNRFKALTTERTA